MPLNSTPSPPSLRRVVGLLSQHPFLHQTRAVKHCQRKFYISALKYLHFFGVYLKISSVHRSRWSPAFFKELRASEISIILTVLKFYNFTIVIICNSFCEKNTFIRQMLGKCRGLELTKPKHLSHFVIAQSRLKAK